MQSQPWAQWGWPKLFPAPQHSADPQNQVETHVELNNHPPKVISPSPGAEAGRARSDLLSIPGIQHIELTTRCCKRLRMGLQPVLKRCFASQRKPRVQCDVVTAKVIKCTLLSRFPKAVLTQRQLLFFHNISILLMNMHIGPINAPANPLKERK